ncbi:polysaccharide biosynthesis tyrosine autokinase [Williamsia sp. D3]|uniref:polysaccharide biosynthesis tyrosine autokinase n=1 Tax=Williamsia sp. D3 TaxID=1313067 RepID=UPI0003D39664|nr:polysaccharide biosynthesis tyrosine autokinase [Williamsia sp. D3]ETD30645.1 hypothetical protein W823_23640 [Williamsia sp. D3]
MSDNNQVGITYRPDDGGNEWLRSTLGALRNSWIILLVSVLVGGFLGLILTTQQTPAYESSAVIYQTPRVSDSESTSRQRTEAYTELLTSDRLITDALEESGIQMSVSDVRQATSAGANEGSAILTVTVRTDSAEKSANLANALANALPATVAALDGAQTPSGRTGGPVADSTRLSVITPATPDDAEGGRNYGRNIAVGIAAGLLVGLLVSYFRSLLSRRVQDEGALTDYLSGPVLASIPVVKSLKESGLVDFTEPAGAAAEAFRRLRTVITGHHSDQRNYRTIVVTSATDGDGKTTTAINLAVALAEAGFGVVFVDASLVVLGSRSESGNRGRGDTSAGLSGYLEGGRDIGEYASPSWQSKLWIVPAGAAVNNPSSLLGSNRMRSGLAELATRSDYVIVDSTSLTRSDSIVLGRAADGVLVVARSNRTKYNDLGVAIERLSLADVPVLGVVLNGDSRGSSVSGRRRGRVRTSVSELLAANPPVNTSEAGAFQSTAGEGRRRGVWSPPGGQV